MNLSSVKHFLLDGDGVLYRGMNAIDGFERFFGLLAEREIGWALLTNNATRARDEYIEKLAQLGLSADIEQIFSSASVTAHHLQNDYPTGATLYVIGEPGMKSQISEAGMRILDGEDLPTEPVDAVVIGLDRSFTYNKLTVGSTLIRGGARFIATNGDLTFPAADGIKPGAGSLVVALEAACGQAPVVVGKPNRLIFEQAMHAIGAPPETTIMVGARRETDILGASQQGLSTILVRSGVTQDRDLARFDYQPTWVMDNLAEIVDKIEQAFGHD
ncbi:MAG: HAD-IIA family hydrolase [Chloroflexi bacterium]|nr:HAD-IIA family hydrolase [Chloroflexota bacterium]